MFAKKTATELTQIYKWGVGEADAVAAREALDATAMERIQASVTREEIEATRTFYQEASANGKGRAVAPQRAAYMGDILNLRK